MGAIFASWAAQTLVLPSPVMVGVEIAMAMLGGALWAGLTGLLKTRLGVNEIFGGVALNSLASVITIYLISGPRQPPEGGSAQSTPPFPMDARLPAISQEFPVSLLALVITGASHAPVRRSRSIDWTADSGSKSRCPHSMPPAQSTAMPGRSKAPT